MTKCVGILGGMGSLATVDLFAKIVANTPAAEDQDHLRIVIDNNPKIPPRVDAILSGAESPLPAMIASAKLLESAGADFIVMPCNTAHYWHEELRGAVSIPFFSMVDTAAEYISQNLSHLNGRLLLLATKATISLGLYQKALASYGIEIQIPSGDEIDVLGNAIKGIKANQLSDNPFREPVETILKGYKAKGTEAVLVGCTELPILMPFLDDGLVRVDVTLLLAKLAVSKAAG